MSECIKPPHVLSCFTSESPHMSRFTIKDVCGDGSCFYRSLYVALLAKNKRLPQKLLQHTDATDKSYGEDAFVSAYRQHLAYIIRRNQDFKVSSKVYKELRDLADADYKLILKSSFPRWFQTRFKTLPPNLSDFKKQFAEGVTQMSNWASEIDVRITKELVRSRLGGLELVIMNQNPPKDFKPQRKTLYLINKNEVHYNALVSLKQVTKSPQQPTTTPKRCDPATKILNPKSNRCVLKTSCTGLRVVYDAQNITRSRSSKL